MKSFEMGGYLPLELNTRPLPWDTLPQKYVFEVNTGRTAIWVAIKSLGIKKLFLPYFYCPDVISTIEQSGVETCFYHIDHEMLPREQIPDKADTAVLLVDYYGLLSGKLRILAEKYSKVILDSAHAFFAQPVLREGVMNVYSLRKFLGVSDGALLIGKGIVKPDLEQDISFHRATHLFKCYETGTNGAYEENKFCERDLTGFKTMSALTHRLLCNADYKAIASKRRRNAQLLEKKLSSIQGLNLLVEESSPYMYPLLLDHDIHKELVSRHIYIPYLWAPLLESKWVGTIENQYSRNVLALPVDQRYNEDDMELLSEIVLEVHERNG